MGRNSLIFIGGSRDEGNTHQHDHAGSSPLQSALALGDDGETMFVVDPGSDDISVF